MSKNLSTREKTLLLILSILLVAALYYLLVFVPTSETMDAARADIDAISDLIIIEQAKAEQLQKMRAALETVAGTPEAGVITPLFDNYRNLLNELNAAVSDADSYKLNFLAPVTENGMVKRELQLVLYTDNYYSAREIIAKLYSGPYRCDITSFKLLPQEQEAADLTVTPVAASVNIIYYEIDKTAVQ